MTAREPPATSPDQPVSSSVTTEPRLTRRRVGWSIGLVFALGVFGPYLFSRARAGRLRVRMLQTEAPAGEVTAGQLRLAAYNIAHGRGLATSNWDGGDTAERTSRLDGIAELLIETDADVVVLNEVDFDCSWSNHVDQARYLAEKAGYRYLCEQRNVDASFLWWRWRFGNAVLSRLPIVEAEPLDYPAYSHFESLLAGRKQGMTCRIGQGDNRFWVAAVHLSHRDESIRNQSVEILTERGHERMILAGDFNSTPTGFPGHQTDPGGRNAITAIDQSGRFLRQPMRTPEPEELTFPSSQPHRVIDWIMIPKQWRYRDYLTLDSPLSDHRPVVASIILSNR